MTTDTQRSTQTQPNPNISTEHQAAGDARRPSDTLDRDDGEDDTKDGAANAKTPLEERENVGSVSPDDYPKGQRAGDTDPD